jgi:hypothetical protein
MASKPLKGYKRLPGSAHRYLDPNGNNISEYAVRSIKARRQKDASGKRVFANYSQQRRFRQSQDFLRARFNMRSLDPNVPIDAGSDLEAALYELYSDPRFGESGVFPSGPEGRFSELLGALGMPDYYFWRFWYSETRAT